MRNPEFTRPAALWKPPLKISRSLESLERWCLKYLRLIVRSSDEILETPCLLGGLKCECVLCYILWIDSVLPWLLAYVYILWFSTYRIFIQNNHEMADGGIMIRIPISGLRRRVIAMKVTDSRGVILHFEICIFRMQESVNITFKGALLYFPEVNLFIRAMMTCNFYISK